MPAKKTVQDDQKSVKRDKKAKIISIQDATCMLIETKGYENVTIRDIAEAGGVSIGLIYKYFPGGKFDILKEIGYRYTDELLMTKQPENIDFNDFPGYMRNVIENMQQYTKDNISLTKALIMTALLDSEIVEEVKNMDFKNEYYKAVSEFFCRFNGVEIGNKDPLDVLMNWGIAVKGIIFCDIIYSLSTIKSEESLIDLMVDVSLKIWGYKEA
ncbi:Transcriptional regulator, TetR family [Methanosarcina horonobensis HB-1 = JCM 15518]|uniref:Transcriptional regulator, TetR family n=1 Tax=Methanosarcina horonobensis HB-1 = JCM 15518 TaxID=1434110 RepID=A0A0E3SGX6_9EURY|nr:TetR/AcrR family transcriptional regulator [Methanosarcina horonobensis]AKB78883.1 Transcriptional regulator, TetR family [Methanosarcina horonobensis HB-1 = JCM 15518]